jgi:hypothetical protein
MITIGVVKFGTWFLCVLIWTTWRLRNGQTFERVGLTRVSIKLFLRTSYQWMTSLGGILSTSF